MKRIRLSGSIKNFFKDSLWSIAGLLIMNAVLQFMIYPVWNARLGSETYGRILYLISLMNIAAIPWGSSANMIRILHKGSAKADSNLYAAILLPISALMFPLAVLLWRDAPSFPAAALYGLLLSLTIWRYYADVEYRLSLNYTGYFLYYLGISAGYLFGLLLFRYTGFWTLALLPGECLATLLVFLRYASFHFSALPDFRNLRAVSSEIFMMVASNTLSTLIFNGDRLILQWFAGGTAVTVFYIASLMGKTASLITVPLSSALAGHIRAYQGKLTKRLYGLSLILTVSGILAATGGTWLFSQLVLRFLYPHEFAAAQAFFLFGNVAYVMYFVGNILMIVLLRFCPVTYQVFVNSFYAAAFCILCVPGTCLWGIHGFCICFASVCLLRLLLIVWLLRNGIDG